MIKKHLSHSAIFIILLFLSVVFLSPIFIIIINSLKFKFSITEAPFALPNNQTFSGFENYITGFTQTGFGTAFFWSLFRGVQGVEMGCSASISVIVASEKLRRLSI